MKYVIKVKDIHFKAKDKATAQCIATDIVNDIGSNGDYTLEEEK